MKDTQANTEESTLCAEALLDCDRYRQSSEQVRHLYGELVERFRQERRQLRELAGNQERKALEFLIHRMSGTSAAFGFHAIHKAADGLEQAFHSGVSNERLRVELANIDQALELSCRTFDRLNQEETDER